MFKRGDIVELNLKRMDGLIEVGILRDADYLISAHDGKVQSTAGYEMTKPPIHEKDGRRFVPSGEYREPLQDEWYLSGPIGEPTHAVLVPLLHYPILLPVPELEPEHRFEVGDTIENHLGNKVKITGFSKGAAGKPMANWGPDGRTFISSLNPVKEFKVGDWVSVDHDDTTCKINSYNQQNNKFCCTNAMAPSGGKKYSSTWQGFYFPQSLTKLPGRPLTTDDLMQVLSGKKITVECNIDTGMCLISGQHRITAEFGSEGRLWLHCGHNHFPPIASFRDGEIVFAEGVEGNIYVVSA